MSRQTLLTLTLLAMGATLAVAQVTDTGAPSALPRAQVEEQLQTDQQGSAPAARGAGRRFVDADGDGVCDNCQRRGQGGQQPGTRGRQGQGPGGTDSRGVAPGNGRSRGSGAGRCDGTGPKGRGRRGGRR
jgi:hypothetical protein